MVTFTLRFYGRFVLAREQSAGVETGHVKFLMPKMEVSGEIEPHWPIMTAARTVIELSPRETSAPPSWRTIGDEATANMQTFHWDLRGKSVVIPSSGGVTQNLIDPIIDLQELERLRNVLDAKLDCRHLQPGDRMASVVDLEGGALTAQAISTNMLAMMTELDARSGSYRPQEPARAFANLITVDVDVAGVMEDGPDGVPTEIGQLQVQLDDKHVTFVAGLSGAIVSFSNLCGCLPVIDPYDFEFAQYHELLIATHSDRLIPFISHGGVQDCNDFCTMAYECP